MVSDINDMDFSSIMKLCLRTNQLIDCILLCIIFIKASLVKFLITTKRHKTDSLLSKSLEEWQGPSLIVYNDSKFTSSDFYNISRIG